MMRDKPSLKRVLLKSFVWAEMYFHSLYWQLRLKIYNNLLVFDSNLRSSPLLPQALWVTDVLLPDWFCVSKKVLIHSSANVLPVKSSVSRSALIRTVLFKCGTTRWRTTIKLEPVNATLGVSPKELF